MSDEEIEVRRGADRVRVEAGGLLQHNVASAWHHTMPRERGTHPISSVAAFRHTASESSRRAAAKLSLPYAVLDELGHHIMLDLIAEVGLAHHRLLSSILGSKAFRTLEAFQHPALTV